MSQHKRQVPRFDTLVLERSPAPQAARRWGASVWLLTLVILLLAFALRVCRLDVQSIWWDEGHSIQMASAALTQIPTLPGMDVHPPGYFALLHQWMSFAGRSEFALRYLSVICSTLTVALLMRFGRSLEGRPVGWLVGVLAALSPPFVAYAQEVRMYAAVTLFALASVYFQWQVLEGWKVGSLEVGRAVDHSVSSATLRPSKGESLIWSLLGYVLVTTASLYTHYFTVFLLLFQNLAWLVWALVPRLGAGPQRRRIAVWLGTQLAILILFLPQLHLALRQTIAYANPNLNPPALGEFISRSWMAYTIGTAVDPAVDTRLAWVLAVVLSIIVLYQLVSARREKGRNQSGKAAFLVGWFLIPLAAYFLVLQRRPSFEPRYMILVVPGLMLLLAWGLNAGLWKISARHRLVWWGRLALLVFLAFFGVGTWSYFTNVETYKDDSAGVAAWLAAETTPSDIVYADVPHPFHYYADRIPAPTRYLFVDVHTAADVLNAEAAGRNRLFWVTWWGSDTDPRGVIPFLLDKAGRRAGELDFRGYHVTWWDLPIDASFSLPNDFSPGPKFSQGGYTFGDVVRLDGLAFSDAAQVGGTAWATLHFTLLRNTDVDYRVSVRLRSPEGKMLPPTDKDLLNDRHLRTSAWPLDDPRLNQAINVYSLPISPEALPGDYCLETVVYEGATLEALPVAGVSIAGCTSPPDNGAAVRLGTVSVSP